MNKVNPHIYMLHILSMFLRDNKILFLFILSEILFKIEMNELQSFTSYIICLFKFQVFK